MSHPKRKTYTVWVCSRSSLLVSAFCLLPSFMCPQTPMATPQYELEPERASGGTDVVGGRKRMHSASPFNKERFCCGNRCLSGPEPGILLLTVFLLSAPAVLVVHDVLPQLSREAQLEAGLGFALLLAAVFGTLFAVAFSDPGISSSSTASVFRRSGAVSQIGRNRRTNALPVSPAHLWEGRPVYVHAAPADPLDPGDARDLTMQTAKGNDASFCQITRSRSRHTLQPAVCTDRPEQSTAQSATLACGVLTTTVLVFFFFVFFAALYALAVAVGAGVAIVQAEINSRGWNVSVETIWQAACDCPRLAGLFVYGVCCSIPLLNLCCFNVYLVGNNLTTNEEILQLFPDRNPYSSGKATALECREEKETGTEAERRREEEQPDVREDAAEEAHNGADSSRQRTKSDRAGKGKQGPKQWVTAEDMKRRESRAAERKECKDTEADGTCADALAPFDLHTGYTRTVERRCSHTLRACVSSVAQGIWLMFITFSRIGWSPGR
ncbi:unnamed protein product [Neospora caninum Liverpool]|uniref:Transmembrane protein n=1 Tax=Neospora caninum (strain Liverpool) TaxID=572307 RepID=F0VMC0_NEOCL|nr:uncharacterized protein NCLIV_048275 [Neospora caninum Liverpool]CBZ54398.1 unnamed protein product [Neospora caninum Liverpool]|eukprot:XP_003884428.1 uncharacterized protein NCLIV_048275 [Neospora caninum Liverpool]